MREILTDKGQVILIDDEDYKNLSQMKWMVDNRGYVRNGHQRGQKKFVWMHRLILGLSRGDDRIVDHINGVKTDNRRSNLRICSKSENGYNQGAQRNNTTGFKGVTVRKDSGRYMAQIRSRGKKIYLGLFDTAVEAHAAYCAAALELHGEFANFGDGR
ncbi:HNH endonuclease [Paraburkholderia phenoliruptrix]|uniref:HNH endonuclease n=1 Tax=Paraburkholderia phenoliruptrix TaxID=252970 RepID=UPI001C4E3B20|nr:HNH endonuclease [Paraburkholderia phenoliruptrix]MBW0450883.1 HNH endonuclease [Paraburkholderia phenoliruptrix]MBW9100976.1 HNH endonuclease [Paraburkholderia phenoliruptrix]